MASKKVEIQRFNRWMQQKLKRDLTSHELAELLEKQNWKMPEPKSALDILAKEISDALREETRYDPVLGQEHHANICYKEKQGTKQLTFWGDIDQVDRRKMVKNYVLRRDQMIGDGTQLAIDLKHWNRINEAEQPIFPELDLTDDVEWRLNAPKQKRNAA